MSDSAIVRLWIVIGTFLVLIVAAIAASASYQADVNQQNQTERVRVCVENGYNAAECEDLSR